MADGLIQVPADSTGKKVDAASLDVGLNTVYRQRIVIGDNSASAQFAIVTAGALTITGNINVSATAVVAFATPQTLNNISATVAVAGTVNLGTTAIVAVVTPFTVNNISATVAAVLGAGAANIGTINDISRTVAVAIATPFTVNNISATVVIAGSVNISATANVVLGAGAANIGTINAISATVSAVLGAGTANIGTLNAISATVTVAGSVNLSATAAVTIATASFVTVRHLSGSLGNVSIGSALTVKTAFASITAASQTIVAAVASTRIRIIGYRIQAQGTTTVNFGAGSSGVQLSQKWSFQAREGTVVNAPEGCFEFQSSAGEGITVQISPTITADVSVVYVEI